MTRSERMAEKIATVLEKNPDLALQFYVAASETVDDFEDYGPVHQADEDGEYSEDTAIRRLQRVRNELLKLIRTA